MLSIGDGIGTVYFSKDLVYRTIHNDRREEVLKLLNCGLIEELVEKKLFPQTRISEIVFDGHDLVLEHEKISPVIYPYEWSPEMLRRAGICLLEISQIAKSYGYELKDAHPYNLVYRNSLPALVDFGSLVEIDGQPGWQAYSEFKQCYFYPLIAYQKGIHSVFKNAFLNMGNGVAAADFYLIKHPLLRALGNGRVSRFFRYWRAYQNPRILNDSVIKNELKYGFLRNFAKFVAKTGWLPFRTTDYGLIKKNLEKIKVNPSTRWINYHSELVSAEGVVDLPPRLARIVSIAEELSPQTVLDLAGNQGALTRCVAKLPSVNQVICADYDEGAIDRLLMNLHQSEKVLPAVFNLMGDMHQAETLARSERLKADLVFALAVTHHLILAQNYNIQAILDAVIRFTRKFAMIEFMPLGLYDGFNSPDIPNWYTEEWFEKELLRRFVVLRKESLEPNRTLYVVELQGE